MLGVPEVGAATNFFELGGDSFDAVRAVSRLDGASVGMLAAHPSVRQLAEALSPQEEEPPDDLDDEIAELERQLAAKRQAKQRRTAPDRIAAVPRDGDLVCTRQQEGLWFMHQLDPSSAVYHIPFALRLRGRAGRARAGPGPRPRWWPGTRCCEPGSWSAAACPAR